MARKKTYIYRVQIGHNGVADVIGFMYARNSHDATSYCKELYREKKYNYYKMIKVGVSHTLQETRFIGDAEAAKLMSSMASQSDKYAERETNVPQFITKEEAGELGL